MSRDKERSTCGNCRFWDELNDTDGLCRRYAPRALPIAVVTNRETGDLERHAAFPVTDAFDWCGELVEIKDSEQRDDEAAPWQAPEAST